jgi:hypothetical protein
MSTYRLTHSQGMIIYHQKLYTCTYRFILLEARILLLTLLLFITNSTYCFIVFVAKVFGQLPPNGLVKELQEVVESEVVLVTYAALHYYY